jgi:hypothetical protein
LGRWRAPRQAPPGSESQRGHRTCAAAMIDIVEPTRGEEDAPSKRTLRSRVTRRSLAGPGPIIQSG